MCWLDMRSPSQLTTPVAAKARLSAAKMSAVIAHGTTHWSPSPAGLGSTSASNNATALAMSSPKPSSEWRALAEHCATVAAIVVADQALKRWAVAAVQNAELMGSRKLVLIEGTLNILAARNPSHTVAALANLSRSSQIIAYALLAIAVMVALSFARHHMRARHWAMGLGLSLLCGGAVANTVDRMLHGYVIDFIDIQWSTGGGSMHWPTFNLADVAIALGLGLMFAGSLARTHPDAAHTTTSG